jgi:predicted membrane GTPase involved in stress response
VYAAGVIDEIGSVDDGSAETYSLVLARQRGITIRSAVVSFAIDDVTVNLIDTPGHPDFIAEVERVLGVFDSAILVVSAVEGVQAPRQSHAHAVFEKAVSSTGRDFGQLAPLVLITALRQAGTRVDEPTRRFQLELPAGSLGAVAPEVERLGGIAYSSTTAA